MKSTEEKLLGIKFDSKLSFESNISNLCKKSSQKLQVLTQSARDVPGTSPEGPLKVLTSGTPRGPLGDSQGTNTKVDDLMKKLFF